MEERKLTTRQRRFVEEYIVDYNATQAAIRAGYSEGTAGGIGFENLRKPQIQAAIHEELEKQSKRTNVTADRIVQELAAMAFERGADWTESKMKNNNKLRALELLGRHFGIFDGQGAQKPENQILKSLQSLLSEDGDQ
ncbi:MAG: terminase small subunit [Alistipes sp.]|nr:terminase small subunit [Alistipes sp.]